MAIDHFVTELSTERKAAIDDFLSEIDKVEKQGKGLVDYTMRWLIVLIVICFFGYITTMVLLRLVPTRSSAKE